MSDIVAHLVNGQIQSAPINLDGATLEDLAAVVAHPAIHSDVKMYAALSHKAQQERLGGNVELALRLEAKADLAYEHHIPAHLRW